MEETETAKEIVSAQHNMLTQSSKATEKARVTRKILEGYREAVESVSLLSRLIRSFQDNSHWCPSRDSKDEPLKIISTTVLKNRYTLPICIQRFISCSRSLSLSPCSAYSCSLL